MSKLPVIIALDYADTEAALAMVGRLSPDMCRVKIGKELFTRGGPQLVEKVQYSGYEVFLDLKFHDIPHTVAAACRAAADLGVWMVNVHALGGRRMLDAAREAVVHTGKPPHLIAVTILTSHSESEIHEVGLSGTAAENVQRLARLSADCGLDGVVCSAREAEMLRTELGPEFLLVTPGIRPSWAESGDQTRVMTPLQAITVGADYLVIGRPVTHASDPIAALDRIAKELSVV